MTLDIDRALSEARTAYSERHPESRRLHFEASKVLPGGNTRSVLDFEPFPFRVVDTDGPYLVDVEGHRYLDLLGNYSAGLLGHRPEAVEKAVVSALQHGWSAGAIRPPETEFARLLCERFPSLEQVRFTNSGTEANLMAIATAQQHTDRSKIVAFHGGYHGGVLYFGETGRGLLAPHDWVMAKYNDPASIEEAFTRHGSEIAAVLVEPMVAASGCIPAENVFLERLRELTTLDASLLIFDEVMTSRLSTGGAQLLYGINPDLTTMGKYLAGGMPIGVFGGRAEVMAVFDRERGGQLTHGGTFNNNEVSSAGGIAALSQVLTSDAVVEVNARGDRLRERLNEILSGSGLTMCATGLGSLMTIHATSGPISAPSDLEDADDRLLELLFFHLLGRGYYIARRGFIALSLDIEDDHVDAFCDELEAWTRSM